MRDGSHQSKYRASIEVLGPVDEDGYDTLTIKAYGKADTAAEAIQSAAAEIDIAVLSDDRRPATGRRLPSHDRLVELLGHVAAEIQAPEFVVDAILEELQLNERH